MDLRAIRTPLIAPGDDLVEVLASSLAESLHEQDLICVVSKAVAVAQGRLVDLATVEPSPEALALSETFPRHAAFTELVLREADVVFGSMGAPFFLTEKNGLLTPNAGVDRSNVPNGYAVLWPDQPWAWVRQFWQDLRARFGLRELGVIITDSQLTPMRRGVTGIALAWAGFEGIESQIGHADLYGHSLAVTEKAAADALAAASVLLTGESNERTPFALIRGAPVTFTEREFTPREATIDPQIDLFRMLLDNFPVVQSRHRRAR
jgi:coenzyme F420-0:L-glutamate ligase / coenzyme F420-1:gamma-L-glutamate ligase